MEALEGKLLGNRYQLLHQVGKGGTALVFEAYDQMLERTVAIKLLRQDFARDPAFRERFRQEAKSAANLSHPNIVIVHDFGFEEAGLYLVMEFLSGKDLKNRILDNRYIPEKQSLPLMIQACAGLGYAHRAGIVHCDVKPQNMLITRDHRLKITDFGIARALSSLSAESHSNIVWGSPLYFSPEQAMGVSPSPASDVYSLGVVLYEMLTGRLPFEAKSIDELIEMHSSQPPPDPREFQPEISDELTRIILKVLSKEPSLRFRTADQFGHILKAIPEVSFTIRTSPPPIPGESSSWKRTPQKPDPIVKTFLLGFEQKKADWKLIGLELLTLLLVGGLVPFGLFAVLKLLSVLR